MIIEMDKKAKPSQINAVKREILKLNSIKARLPEERMHLKIKVSGENLTLLGVEGDTSGIPNINDFIQRLRTFKGVVDVIRITEASQYKLASRAYGGRLNGGRDTVVELDGGVKVGGNRFTVIAGPCAAESYEQLLAIAIGVYEAGADAFRCCIYKPRTSPYSYQGIAAEQSLRSAIEIVEAVRKELLKRHISMPFGTEVTDTRQVEQVAPHFEFLWVGARNTQTFELIKEVARSGLPMILKRGTAERIEHWLGAAEYGLLEYHLKKMGPKLILCERGLCNFDEKGARNIIDLGVITPLEEKTHLPAITDPSHGTGSKKGATRIAAASLSAGAKGVILEVHNNPSIAKSDAAQQITIPEFSELMRVLRLIANVHHVKMNDRATLK